MKIAKILWAFACCMLVIAFTSCESDDSITNKLPEEIYIEKAKEILNGEIVLSSRATMNNVDKTLLPQGCPTKFNFSWKEDGMMVLRLDNFAVGTMPFAISFRCANKPMKLNSWELEKYTEEGWIKFVGKDGKVTSSSDDSDTQAGSGATVQGYLNVNSMEVIFLIDYNMMNVRSECFRQVINKDRIKHFDEEFAKFEEDLKKYKEEHGL